MNSPPSTRTGVPAIVSAGISGLRRFFPFLFFVGGFLWDVATLTRIDRLSDNLIFLGYIVLLGGLLLLTTRVAFGAVSSPVLLRHSKYYPWMMQFLFGSLFSGYVIYYFKSMTLAGSAIFFLVLVALLITNEFLEDRMTNVYMTLALYTFCVFAFLVFFIPVVTGYMNRLTFVLAGFLSITVAGVIVRYIWAILPDCTPARVARLMTPSLGIWLLMMALYFSNLLPPVPLSMKEGGIYRHVERQGNAFILTYESPSFWQFWSRTSDPFHYRSGDTAYCFSAVFAPKLLHKQIYHHWKVFRKGGWESAGRMGFGITGGREAGFRGYTFKRNLTPGEWRVDIETEEGQIMGRISFEVMEGEPSTLATMSR